jgi:hypothetical protein
MIYVEDNNNKFCATKTFNIGESGAQLESSLWLIIGKTKIGKKEKNNNKKSLAFLVQQRPYSRVFFSSRIFINFLNIFMLWFNQRNLLEEWLTWGLPVFDPRTCLGLG